MDMMFAQNPNVAKVGLLYSLNEPNSTKPIADAKAYLDAKGIEYVEQTANTNDEVVAAASALIAAGVDAVVGLPCITYIRLDFNYNFVPFLHMFSDYRSSLLNVLLFVPLGFFLPLFWKKFSAFGHTLLFGFCTSLLIELLQIFTFRATDVNDLMTNTVGTVLGYLLARVVLKLFPGTKPSARIVS